MLEVLGAPGNTQAMWYINTSNQNGKSGNITVIVDADTGTVRLVIQG